MPRVTKVKVGGLDLDNIFAQGYVTRQGKVVTGDYWKYYKWDFPDPIKTNVTTFQLPITISIYSDSSPKLKMTVNGMIIDKSLLSIHPNATNTLVYDSSNPDSYQIDDTDLVEFWLPETTN